MKKRRLFGIATLIGISAICLAGAACLSACGGSDNQVNVNDYLDEYGWHYQQAFVGEKDADMKIDGVLDEARWKEEEKTEKIQQQFLLPFLHCFQYGNAAVLLRLYVLLRRRAEQRVPSAGAFRRQGKTRRFGGGNSHVNGRILCLVEGPRLYG